MGSDYRVHNKDGFEVRLSEAGDDFKLMLKASDELDTRHVRVWSEDGRSSQVQTAMAYTSAWLTAEEVLDMGISMIRAASFHCDRDLVDAAAMKVLDI